jgi:hypothetical protein
LIHQVADAAERNALTQQAGMQVFQTDNSTLYLSNGTNWAILNNVPETTGGATLVNGEITILDTNIEASSNILLSYSRVLGVPGVLYADRSEIIAGTQFIIRSTSQGDNSDIIYNY